MNSTCTVKAIYEPVIIDSNYGWDTIEVKSLGFYENWYDAAKAADDYVNNNSNWRWPPLRWKIKQHKLFLKQLEE